MLQILETVGEIQRKLGSSGTVEQDAVLEGNATQDEVARTFPKLVGSHLKVSTHLIG